MTVCNMSHRGGRPGRHDRPRRDHVRLPQGPRRTRRRAPTGTPPSRTGGRCAPTTTRSFDKEVVIDARRRSRRSSPGAPTPARACRCRRRARPERLRRRRSTSALRRAGAGLHGPRRPARRCATSRSTPSSSAPAPTAGSRTCGSAAEVIGAARSPTASGCSSCPGSVLVRLQAEAEGLDKVFTAAGAEWRRRRLLDVPGHEPRHAGAGRAQRLHLQPQLRGPAGQGRPHPPGLARCRRRHRRHRHARPPPGLHLSAVKEA